MNTKQLKTKIESLEKHQAETAEAIETYKKELSEHEEKDKNKASTKIVKLSFGTFEVETKIHHLNKTYAECEKDCPKGWEIVTYPLLQELRNTQAKEFNLIDTLEFVQQPDKLSNKNSYVARFFANSVWAGLYCFGGATYTFSSLGVRFVRKILGSKQIKCHSKKN